jgi:tetratricopeptide (TPR) repeat protein
VSLGSTPSALLRADEITGAQASVNAARTDVEKINALYNYARSLNAKAETFAQRQQAFDAVKQALALVAKMEKSGATLKPQSQIHYLAGRLALFLDDPTSAVAYFNDAERNGFVAESAASGGKSTALFRLRGEAKWKNYDYPGALADINRAIELESNKGDYADRARLHFDMGNATAARADWGKGDQFTIAEQEDYVQAARARARLDGQSTQAIEAFPFDGNLLPLNAAIAQNPRATAPLLARASYLIRRGAGYSGGQQGELDKAMRDVNYVLRLEPGSAAAYHLSALALWRLGTVKSTLPQKGVHEAVLLAFGKALKAGYDLTSVRFDIGDYFIARTRLNELTPDERREALGGAIYNYSAIIRQEPQNSIARAKRIRAEGLRARPDANSVLTDSAAISPGDGVARDGVLDAREAEELRAEVENARVQAFLQNGELTQAQNAVESALKKAARAAELLRLHGQILTMRGRYADATKELQNSLAERRNFASTWWWLGMALDGAGNIAQAKQALENAQKLDASLAPFIVGTRYAADKPTEKPLVMPPVTGELKPQGTALQHKEAGNALNGKDDADGAIAEYSTALLIDPNFTDALSNRANLYWQRGTLDLALADINRALELEPQHRTASLVRAEIRMTLGDTTPALEDLNNALRYADTDGRRINALLSRARLHQRLKDKTSAQTDLNAAAKLAENNAEQKKRVDAARAELEK